MSAQSKKHKRTEEDEEDGNTETPRNLNEPKEEQRKRRTKCPCVKPTARDVRELPSQSDRKKKMDVFAYWFQRRLKSQTKVFLLGAFGLIAALAWNDAVKSVIYENPKLRKFGPWIYAVVITLLFVLVSVLVEAPVAADLTKKSGSLSTHTLKHIEANKDYKGYVQHIRREIKRDRQEREEDQEIAKQGSLNAAGSP